MRGDTAYAALLACADHPIPALFTVWDETVEYWEVTPFGSKANQRLPKPQWYRIPAETPDPSPPAPPTTDAMMEAYLRTLRGHTP